MVLGLGYRRVLSPSCVPEIEAYASYRMENECVLLSSFINYQEGIKEQLKVLTQRLSVSGDTN